MPRWFVTLALVGMLSACGANPAATPPPTNTIAPPTLTPEATHCAWTQAYSEAPPELVADAEQRLAASGVAGKVRLTASGENNSCDGFHLAAVDFEFSLRIDDLADQATMQTMVSAIEPIPAAVMRGNGNLGSVRIKFENASEFCWWQGGGCGEGISF